MIKVFRYLPKSKTVIHRSPMKKLSWRVSKKSQENIYAWVFLNRAACLLSVNLFHMYWFMNGSSSAHSYVLINIVFIFITAAFKKGIDELVSKPKTFDFSRTFLFFPFPIPFLSLFLCIPPKCCCITRILMNYLIGKKEVGKKWLNFG